MKTLIRRRVRVLRRLIWVCTVCLCSKNGTLGLYGLIKKSKAVIFTFYKTIQILFVGNKIRRWIFLVLKSTLGVYTVQGIIKVTMISVVFIYICLHLMLFTL